MARHGWWFDQLLRDAGTICTPLLNSAETEAASTDRASINAWIGRLHPVQGANRWMRRR